MPPHRSSPYGLRPPKSATTTPMKPGSPALQAPPLSEFYDSRTRMQRLLQPRHKTSPLIWCGAVVCVVFSLLLILAGVITLIIFLVVKPRNPSLDLTAASLNTIYIDSSTYLNSDFTFLANFSNPNHKIDFTFEYLGVELYFHDRIIAVQAVQPFAQRTGESRLESVHMVSSEVPLPPGLALQLQQQVRSNSVVYSIRGTFKVKASLGAGHFSYWIYPRCDVELSAPPNGVLVAKRCRMKS
ncbi:unnamed protein product [Musa acuminata subsp. malaccensis]|uniref:(wild Malaysian banana) hypothetical protein n=1 Tax=Musa acuminata subsp. malaccensis TaxID=214687 RepID=A0A804KPQ5_MUSAM|nr:PREDICTED: uncharacterized protein LOC103999245 [Musa acuminata subsp. malaccensis]CAG1836759.1 unnamed protein product [Musa acuminata subsp. malaccensis]